MCVFSSGLSLVLVSQDMICVKVFYYITVAGGLIHLNHGATCPSPTPQKCYKVFCALVVTVKTCVLRATTKKVVNVFQEVHP